jgi:hypothetical protein
VLEPGFFVGFQSVIDGVSDVGQHAIALRLGVALGSIGVSLFGSASLGSAVSDRFVDLRLSRHSAGVAFDLQRRLWDRWRGSVGVHGGAVLYVRSSAPKDASVAQTGTVLVAAAAFGPELGLQFEPSWVGLGLRLALDVLPNAPSFQLAARTNPMPAPHSAWSVEPRIALGLEGRL